MLEHNRKHLGRVQEVLIEGPSPRGAGRYTGRTVHHRIVHFAAEDAALIGTYRPVRVTEALSHSLVGELQSDYVHAEAK